MTKAFEHATKGEARFARKLLRTAFKRGYHVSINDGGDWVVKFSRDITQCSDALCSTGEDFLIIGDATTKAHVGSLTLVWGNADDGSELIADCSDNEAIAALVAAVEA